MKAVPNPQHETAWDSPKKEASNLSAAGKIRFRQQRHSNELFPLMMNAGKGSGRVINWSRTGLAFEVDGNELDFQPEQRIDSITLTCRGICVYDGTIRIRSKRTVAPDRTQYGASFEGGLLLVEGVESAATIAATIESAKTEVSEINAIDDRITKLVVGLQCALEIVKSACEHEDRRWAPLPADLRIEAENVFMPNMAEQVLGILSTFNKGLASLVDVETLKEGSTLHRLFDRLIYPYFKGADVFRRTHDKPRGYAGDYEMMNQVYRDGYEGKDLFSRVLHHYGTIEECGESVKFRRPYLQGHLNQIFRHSGEVTALAIASGPAVECQSLVKETSQENLDRLELTLFDLDREALEHAQTKLYEAAMSQQKTVRCHFVNDSVKAFLSSDYALEGNYDLIYSAGLFDYLDQKTATVLVNRFFRLLSSRGKLVVGNFTKGNQSKAFLTLLCQWKLVHRTPEEMLEWAKGLEGCTATIETDPGENLAFVVIERRG